MSRVGFRRSLIWLPLGLSFSLSVGCSGNSTGDSGGAGTGGTSTATAGTNSSSGTGNKAGSSNSGGTNSGPGGGDFSTSVPSNKPLSDLTPAEVTQLCDDLDAYYSSSSVASDLEEYSCRLIGVIGAVFGGAETDAAAKAACQMAYDSCVTEPGTTTSECGAPEGTCTATVAELAACTNDTGEFLGMAKDSLPACSELTLADLEGAGPTAGPMEPASCTTFEMKCPGGPVPPTSGM